MAKTSKTNKTDNVTKNVGTKRVCKAKKIIFEYVRTHGVYLGASHGEFSNCKGCNKPTMTYVYRLGDKIFCFCSSCKAEKGGPNKFTPPRI